MNKQNGVGNFSLSPRFTFLSSWFFHFQTFLPLSLSFSSIFVISHSTSLSGVTFVFLNFHFPLSRKSRPPSPASNRSQPPPSFPLSALLAKIKWAVIFFSLFFCFNFFIWERSDMEFKCIVKVKFFFFLVLLVFAVFFSFCLVDSFLCYCVGWRFLVFVFVYFWTVWTEMHQVLICKFIFELSELGFKLEKVAN